VVPGSGLTDTNLLLRYRPAVRRRGGDRTGSGLVLLLTPILWGATFPGGKIALRHLPTPAFMAWSRLLGVLAIVALLPILRKAGEEPRRPIRDVIGPGVLLGALMFIGYTFQTEGLARTTATNAGFITGLYVVFTPLFAMAVFGHRAPRSAWAAVVISFGGLALLSITHLGTFRLHVGDLLVLAGAVAWAGHIATVGHYSTRFAPWLLSLAQMGVAAVLHLASSAGVGLHPGVAASLEVWPLLVLTGILGSGVAFTIQIVGQRDLTPARAVVLLAGETLFSALFSAIWIDERLALHQWAGALLVLAAMAYSELSARRSPAEMLDPASAP
jgi:drug/metabolite transporter (DMT)-like permease